MLPKSGDGSHSSGKEVQNGEESTGWFTLLK